eukprot:TRINITY_DN47683_c0_g2_i1.p1 TRINITY_DN47683_c0_g2~~TRINITY_DN47683_c0_g2_i1.p1  ORF type:complete len:125 (-),score=25.18 TRINITY_DN47683_c0_g2_i1:253-627(-)
MLGLLSAIDGDPADGKLPKGPLKGPDSVAADYALLICDSSNNRVTRWTRGATTGTVVAGGNGRGPGLNQLTLPHGIAVEQSGDFLLSEMGFDRVTRWPAAEQQEGKPAPASALGYIPGSKQVGT